MWLILAPTLPKPDRAHWPGRALLAAVDAVLWPALWAYAFMHAPQPIGLMGPFVAAVSVMLGIGRLHRAVCQNHRYFFTTWRWGKLMAWLLVLGVVMKGLIFIAH